MSIGTAAIEVGPNTRKFFAELAIRNADAKTGVSRGDLDVLAPLAVDALIELESLGTLPGKKGERLERKIDFIRGMLDAGQAIPLQRQNR